MTVLPLMCIVCECSVHDPSEWVHARPDAPIYGLHHHCVNLRRIRGWNADGSPNLETLAHIPQDVTLPRGWHPDCAICRAYGPYPHRFTCAT